MKKRSDGRFCRKIKINNKFVFFYSSEATEKQAARDIEQQLIQYRDKEKNGKLFAEAAKEWSEYHFPTLEHNSLKQYRPAFNELVEQFGEFYIKNITSNQIDLFLKNYAKRGYAQKTVKTRLLVMNLIMKYAVINQYIPNNPCLYVTIPKNLPKKNRETLTDDEIITVKNSIDKTFGLFAYFLLNTGLRKGEALALKYSDLDFDKKTIHVNKTVEWVGNVPNIKDHPKTDAGIRDVPLLDCLINVMEHKNSDELIL